MDRSWEYQRLAVVATRALGAAGLVACAALFGASPAAAAWTCGNVTPSLIKSTLHVVVPAPTQERNGRLLQCTYGQLSANAVVVSVQTGMSPATFRFERRTTFGRARTKMFPGLGLPAFSSVEGTGRNTNTGVVVLKGQTMLNVLWDGPLAKIAVLVKKILPSV